MKHIFVFHYLEIKKDFCQAFKEVGEGEDYEEALEDMLKKVKLKKENVTVIKHYIDDKIYRKRT